MVAATLHAPRLPWCMYVCMYPGRRPRGLCTAYAYAHTTPRQHCGSTCRCPANKNNRRTCQHSTARDTSSPRTGRCHILSMGGAEKLERDRQGLARFSCRPHAPRALRAHAVHARQPLSAPSPQRPPSCSRTPARCRAMCVMLPDATPTMDPLPCLIRACRAWGAALYHRPRLVIALSSDVCRCTFGTFVICTIAVRG